jgi:hypothetical protein
LNEFKLGRTNGWATRFIFPAANGPAPFTAVDIRTGKVLWQKREFPKVMMV